MECRDKEEKPKNFWFNERRVERVGLVSVPAGIIAIIASASMFAAVVSQQWLLLLLSVIVVSVVPIAFVIGGKTECYFDVAHDVLAVRKGISWRLLAGFRAMQLPTNVDGNQDRLLRALYGAGKGITFRIIVSRHIFTRVVKSRPGSWFEPEAPVMQTVKAEMAGHAWMLVLEKHVSLLAGIRRELAAFMQTRDATASTFPNTYMHHGFRAMDGEELAMIVTL
jgi:hypothetical protein